MTAEKHLLAARTGESALTSEQWAEAGTWLSTDRCTVFTVVGLVVGLAAFYLAPSPVLSLPGLIVAAVLAWRRLDLALAVLPLTFPYWYVPKRVFGHEFFPLSEVALAVCVLIGVARLVERYARVLVDARSADGDRRNLGWSRAAWERVLRTSRAQLRPLVVDIGPLVVLGAVLLLLGAGTGVVIARRFPEALRAYRWEVAEPLIYLVLVVLCVRSAAAIRALVWSLLGSALIVAVLATAQVLWLHVTFSPLAAGNTLVRYLTPAGDVPRATGIIYGSGNSLGAALERALPLALALACVRGASSRAGRIVALACAVAYLPALAWSGSRGAYVGAVIGCAVVLAAVALERFRPRDTLVPTASSGAQQHLRLPHDPSPLRGGGRGRGSARPLFVIITTIVIAALAILALWRGDTLVAALVTGHGGSGEVRLLVWLAALHMIRDHPLFGIGPDQFLYYYSNLYTAQPYWISHLNGRLTLAVREPTLSHPHNLVLDLWLSGGLLGLVGFTCVLLAFWRRTWRVWVRSSGWSRAVTLGLAGSVLAGIVHGMVDSAYFEPDLALTFWSAVAVVVVLSRAIPSAAEKPAIARAAP